MKRRNMLLSAVGIGGALLVGWGVMPQRSRLGTGELMLPKEGDVALNGWIKIAADGTVVLAMSRSEMGQGVHTALAMMAAEE
jgi:isoquinoline 1-oxidoreductase subunit beta